MRLNPSFSLFIGMSFFPIAGFSQKEKIKAVAEGSEFRHALNRAFNKLASGNPNAGEVTNYASIDPVNSSFDLKASIPLFTGRNKLRKLPMDEQLTEDRPRFSYLAIGIDGGLVDGNYAAIFNNSRLNAGINMTAQYNFMIGRPKFSYWEETHRAFSIEKTALLNRYRANKIGIRNSLSNAELGRRLRLTELTQISVTNKLQKKRTEAALVKRNVDDLGDDIVTRPGLIDTLLKINTELAALQKEYDSGVLVKDSLENIGSFSSDFIIAADEKLGTALKKDYEALLSNFSFVEATLWWISTQVKYSRKSFNTFDITLPFEDQISKGNFKGWSFGAAGNMLVVDSIRMRTWFANLSITRSQANNLAALSTSSIEQRQQFVNNAGNITRTISKKISAYTDPVKQYKLWTFSLHGYYLFGKSPSGIHFFPSVEAIDNSKAISNLGVGYIIPFQNKKDQSILNIEVYARFDDLFNKLNDDSKFYSRNEIGISFTHPFKIF